MGVDVWTEVFIERPRDEVAAFMFDPANDAAWTTGVISARPLAPGRLRPGSAVEREVKFLGRRFGSKYECVAADDDHFVELHVDQPFPMHIRYELEDAAGGTRAAIQARGDAKGFFRIAAPLLAPMVRRNIHRDLAELKKTLEARPAAAAQ